ncbi:MULTISPECIES: hypothetical protein [Vibrio]|uniref:PFGI-1 class ICE element type IV pilus protein PilL2 n=1 Tax=Vibrio TaxID=662 RepID=UPI000841A922|nr:MULTISPECIES: hypothetical protein [Vibrio]ODM56987.1 hypothetical protein BC455_18005 [Vibrio harveyi]USD58669.1 hypothetical protein J4N44_27335 [Vibrio sp. SCSIO 43155]
MNSKQFISSFVAVLLSGSLNAETFDNNEQVYQSQNNGYTAIVIDTNYEQKYPLQTITSIQIPTTIKNVGQAINYVLQNSGYQLEDLSSTNEETLHLYTLEIPLVHRDFKQSSVIQIVDVLVGTGFNVTVDHVKRELSINPTS